MVCCYVCASAAASTEPRDEQKGVPGFWYQCISNHPAVGALVAEDDVAALEALTNISVDYNDDYSGFKLTFTFSENDYFTNTVRNLSVSST